ncbi:unnamed protein product [Amaranthus hypochondriacus]
MGEANINNNHNNNTNTDNFIRKKAIRGDYVDGFSSNRASWRSRKNPASSMNVGKPRDERMFESPTKQGIPGAEEEKTLDATPPAAVLSERRKALFEPLEPIDNISRKRPSNESLLPPPDFDSTTYPKGWLIGKKRKLVNVDVVESMRRIAVQEMNRKDREIDGLAEQLDEDSRVLEHLQMQLLEEKRKRADAERENTMLQDQINMLMNMLQENEAAEEENTDEP